jgi:hypothetical protein
MSSLSLTIADMVFEDGTGFGLGALFVCVCVCAFAAAVDRLPKLKLPQLLARFDTGCGCSVCNARVFGGGAGAC